MVLQQSSFNTPQLIHASNPTGMTTPFKDRKILLKEMKSKLGGGGALVEGVLELQGSHCDKVLEMLKSKGYSDVKIVGGK